MPVRFVSADLQAIQIIIVDNDIPESMEGELKQYVRKHYSVNSSLTDTEIGFINDASPTSESPKDGKTSNKLNEELGDNIFFDDDDLM